MSSYFVELILFGCGRKRDGEIEKKGGWRERESYANEFIDHTLFSNFDLIL